MDEDNHYIGRIIRVVPQGLAYVVSTVPIVGEQFGFTFDKIMRFGGRWPWQLKEFDPHGLVEGVLVAFTVDSERKVTLVYPSPEYAPRKELGSLRQSLRQLLADHGVASNPAVENYWIVDQLKQLLSTRR